jgi:hypothetical protein
MDMFIYSVYKTNLTDISMVMHSSVAVGLKLLVKTRMEF